jgi:hypothetical protein
MKVIYPREPFAGILPGGGGTHQFTGGARCYCVEQPDGTWLVRQEKANQDANEAFVSAKSMANQAHCEMATVIESLEATHTNTPDRITFIEVGSVITDIE